MRGLFTNNTLAIPSGNAVSGVAHRAQTLRILRGRVWVTVEGIPHDYFLHAGDTFTAIPGRLIVVEADHDAGIELPQPTPLRALKSAHQWLAALVARLTQSGTVQTSLKRHRACCDACC